MDITPTGIFCAVFEPVHDAGSDAYSFQILYLASDDGIRRRELPSYFRAKAAALRGQEEKPGTCPGPNH